MLPYYVTCARAGLGSVMHFGRTVALGNWRHKEGYDIKPGSARYAKRARAKSWQATVTR